MSFSSEIKEELNKNSNLANKEMVKYELLGYLLSGNMDLAEKKSLKFSTESDYNINRFSKLLSNLKIDHNIEIVGKNFVIKVKEKKLENLVEVVGNNIIMKKENQEGLKKQENQKALIRGCFMGSGSINNPENTYHLEMTFSTLENRKFVEEELINLGVKVKTMESQNKYMIYLKEGEEISKLLALMGANKAVLSFENIRIEREMRGKVNRLVNCKTANLNKTINASIEQIAAIKKLKETGRFNRLNENLKEIAKLRLAYPDMPLSELGEKLKEPVGKSGVNYRLKKIMEIADE